MDDETASGKLSARVVGTAATRGALPAAFALLVAFALLGLPVLSGAIAAPQRSGEVDGTDAPTVATIEVHAEGIASAFELDGSLQAVRQSSVAAQVSGSVVERLVDAGDAVRAGQPLFRIDARQTEAGLARSQAAVARAQAELAEAQAAYERDRKLLARGFVSEAALDAALARLRIAQAAERESVAERSQAALARNFTTVVAPYDGVVLATHVEAGDFVAPGAAVASIHAPQPIRAVVYVPASRQAAVRAAWPVEVRLPSGERAVAVSREAVPGVDPVSQTVEYRFDLPAESTRGWVPGRSVRVRFADDAATRRIVPAAAILRRGELTAVYVARGERFVLRAVRVGVAHGDAGVEVLAGIAEGERIAADPVRAGLYGARPGVALQ